MTPDGVLVIDYQPPKPMLDDALLGFQLWARDPWINPSVSVHIAPDRLGPLNSHISLHRNIGATSTRMGRAVLYPVRQGSTVEIGQDGDSSYGPGWRALAGLGLEPYRADVWFVTVDGKRILEVPYSAALPDVAPRPPVPWWQRARRRVRTARRDWLGKHRPRLDRIARPLGYVHGDEIEDRW
jgi:hypothetical protein